MEAPIDDGCCNSSGDDGCTAHLAQSMEVHSPGREGVSCMKRVNLAGRSTPVKLGKPVMSDREDLAQPRVRAVTQCA